MIAMPTTTPKICLVLRSGSADVTSTIPSTLSSTSHMTSLKL